MIENDSEIITELDALDKEDAHFFSFVPLFTEYCRLSTDAPSVFAEIIGIQMLGHALGYETVHLIQPKAVHHNMNTLLVGDSTIARKSTVQSLGKSVYPRNRWVPAETSPESLLEILSDQNEGFQWLGEFSGLLKGIKNGGYMARFAEVYNDLISCEPYSRKLRTRKNQRTLFEIEKPFLSVSSTITPELLKEHLTTEIVRGGFLPRWLISKGEANPKPRGRLHENVAKWDQLLKKYINKVLSLEKDAQFVFSDKALSRFNEIEQEWYKRQKILPFVGRYENYLIAISDILLVSDAIGIAFSEGYLNELTKLTQLTKLTKLIDSSSSSEVKEVIPGSSAIFDKIVVPERYVERAYNIISPCIDTAEYFSEYVEVEKVEAKIMDLLKRYAPIVHTKLLQRSHATARDFENAITTLKEKGLVRVEKEKFEKIGRKTRRIYHWLGKK